MPNREKVMKGLECCVRYMGECEECPYEEGRGNCGCGKQLYADALTLLKAQEPRVITYDELATFDGAFLIESSAVLGWLDWVFFFDTDTKNDEIWVEDFNGERYTLYREDYGTYMRCWTSRPTDEQREATPWR